MSPPLRVVPEQPTAKHWLLVGLAEAEEQHAVELAAYSWGDE